MNITLFYNEGHLQKAVAINNSNNPELKQALSLEEAEQELINVLSDNLEELNVFGIWGVYFIPEIISDTEGYEDIGILLHITTLASYENKEEDLKSVMLSSNLEVH